MTSDAPVSPENSRDPISEENSQDSEEKYLRALADLQNVRRRAEEDRLRLPGLGKIALFRALLPILDAAELALQHFPEAPQEWDQGAAEILKNLVTLLEKEGFERINTTGVPLDPHCHEVLMSSGQGIVVATVLQSGWRFHDTIVRAAKVQAGDPAPDLSDALQNPSSSEEGVLPSENLS